MPFHWKQPPLKFAKRDFQLNWRRWSCWGGLYTAAVAVAVAFKSANRGDADYRRIGAYLIPALFFGALAFQFLMALMRSQVEIARRAITLGSNRNRVWFRLEKIASVHFKEKGMGSMLVRCKSGRRVEIFLDSHRDRAKSLIGYFASAGVAVTADGELGALVESEAKKFSPTFLRQKLEGIPNGTSIAVRGWSADELGTIVTEFSGMYDLEPAAVRIGTWRNDAFILLIPAELAADQFLFLVNYLCYPRVFSAAGRSMGVLGRGVVAPAAKVEDPSTAGQRAEFYVPANDTDFDVVYATIPSGVTFRIPFTNMKWHRVEDARRPASLKGL